MFFLGLGAPQDVQKEPMVAESERPGYRGIRTYRDPHGRFAFRYPLGWHQHELADDRDGVLFSPQPQDPETWFAVWATRLQDAVKADDLAVLHEGVDEGLYQLPGVRVESSSETTFGNLIRFERIYTFQENGSTRRRKVWMMYVYKWAFALIAQGATPEEYEHWSMMLEDCFGAFNLAPTLWFASDPDMADRLD
jgi:hypothetical protein